MLYRGANRFREAAELQFRALQISPNNAAVRSNYGAALSNLGEG